MCTGAQDITIIAGSKT